ncbi:nucleosome assembly factor ASF1 [Aspergillus saccharolyticus JOP 1030-1]|uniref:Histone chaperone n=1 Tax=Aspergillus saccharolyticus JOP 1030-1 TaxID=1450539 RepID=A0A318Z221_9EURO|nr:histone deposition protein Asf1 [Aspergillus saccharolyticus JOP 1030-1]PYH41335.1 histone deposition protein Asf1 [Aspergillus saccharolyticus JOP 1030-1]
MSVVSLLGVKIVNNPAPFTAPYQFEITFECLEQLQKDLEWKLTYVGSATSSEYDQELDSLLVGPIPVGVNKFIFEADPPDLKRIPTSEILGVTVILLTCSYDGREFVRVGYYVNNEYDSEELSADPPAKPIIERIRRNILAEKPRVTRFAIKWDSEESAPAEYPPDQPDADLVDDSNTYGAEEAELEAALVKELEEAERQDTSRGEDQDMEGGEATAGDEEDISDAESEDIEDESDDDDEELDEEEGGDADEDIEMGDDTEPKDEAAGNASNNPTAQHQPELMVH